MLGVSVFRVEFDRIELNSLDVGISRPSFCSPRADDPSLDVDPNDLEVAIHFFITFQLFYLLPNYTSEGM